MTKKEAIEGLEQKAGQETKIGVAVSEFSC
jgi:hypothetical protein